MVGEALNVHAGGPAKKGLPSEKELSLLPAVRKICHHAETTMLLRNNKIHISPSAVRSSGSSI
jgi:hypothetical protein